MVDQLTIEIGTFGSVSALAYDSTGSTRLGITLVLAHGAGANQTSRFMVRFGTGLASRGLDVLTFNFLYTEQGRRAPDRTDKLEACYRAVAAAARDYDPWTRNALFLGGKSMGGRMASHLGAASGDGAVEELRGLVFLGYPLHPPGKPDRLRSAHLPNIRVPMLFVQGARDPFGTEAELRPILDALQAPVTLHVVENGDHSLSPPKRGPVSIDDVYDRIQDTIADWATEVVRGSPRSERR
jgi:hypothetical protein